MRFRSKADMAQALLEGRTFRYADEHVAFYDDTETDPFRYLDRPMGEVWNWYAHDEWTEVSEQHAHSHDSM